LKLKFIAASYISRFFIKVAQLRLALVKLVKVRIFKGYAGMGFVNVDAEVVGDMLNSEVLSQRAELIINVLIISSFVSLLLL
jgi:hypothetical protein